MTEQLCDFPTCQLARQKGFDEPCMYAYINRGKPKEVNPIMGHNVFDVFENQMKLEKKHPGAMDALRRRTENHMVINSERPPHIYGRPTQDLLDDWLLEVHGITIWVCPGLEKSTFNCFHEDGAGGSCVIAVKIGSRKLAREAAIVHALKLLPDAK